MLLHFSICMTFSFLKYKNSPDFFNDVRTCTRSDFFASEFMNISDDSDVLVARMSSTLYSVSKLSFFQLLILLSDDINLNPRHTRQHEVQQLNKWNIFKTRGLHFIYLNSDSCGRRSSNVESWLSQLIRRLQVSVNLNQMNLYWNLRSKMITIKFSDVTETDMEQVWLVT